MKTMEWKDKEIYEHPETEGCEGCIFMPPVVKNCQRPPTVRAGCSHRGTVYRFEPLAPLAPPRFWLHESGDRLYDSQTETLMIISEDQMFTCPLSPDDDPKWHPLEERK